MSTYRARKFVEWRVRLTCKQQATSSSKTKKEGTSTFVHSIFRSTLHNSQHHPHYDHIHSFYNCTRDVIFTCECDIELFPSSSAGERFMTRCTRRFIVLPLCCAVTSSNACILDDGIFCLDIATLCFGRLCRWICEVVMAAFHTAPCELYEPLVMNLDERSIDQVNRECRFLNSSMYSRKIVSLEDDGVTLITSGWRADGVIFYQEYRPILKSDTVFYGIAVDLTAYSADVRLLVIHGCFISFLVPIKRCLFEVPYIIDRYVASALEIWWQLYKTIYEDKSWDITLVDFHRNNFLREKCTHHFCSGHGLRRRTKTQYFVN